MTDRVAGVTADRGERLGPYRALNHCFEVEVDDETLTAWCRRALRPLESSTSTVNVTCRLHRDGDGTWGLEVGGVQICRRAPPYQVLPMLMVDFNRRTASSTTEHLVLHAGVVGSRDGVIMMPAPSGGGKSTSVTAAALRGRAYGADEHAAIRLDDGLVEPIPKPVALKHGSTHLFPTLTYGPDSPMAPFFENQLLVSPNDLPGGVLTRAAPVEAIVVPVHHAGVPPSVQYLKQAEGLMAMRENAFNFTIDQERSFQRLAALVRQIPVYRLLFGDAASAWEVLDDYVP